METKSKAHSWHVHLGRFVPQLLNAWERQVLFTPGRSVQPPGVQSECSAAEDTLAHDLWEDPALDGYLKPSPTLFRFMKCFQDSDGRPVR